MFHNPRNLSAEIGICQCQNPAPFSPQPAGAGGHAVKSMVVALPDEARAARKLEPQFEIGVE